jgi:dimeric dUTPase (all-alpha-NTP-PPase superfamily)
VMDRLQQMLDMQAELQRKINGPEWSLNQQTDRERISNIQLNMFALMAELYEMMNEMTWKPWATAEPSINFPRARAELIDVWHFFMNLMLHLGIEGDDLYRLYREKNTVNHKRQDDGYDGVKEKCPQCHRDLSEIDPKEVRSTSGPDRVNVYCVCGHLIRTRPV